MLLHNSLEEQIFKKKHSIKMITLICLAILLLFFVFFLPMRNTAIAISDDDIFFSEPTVKTTVDNIDPWEPFNRKIFKFNVFIYDNLLIPFGDFYTSKVPLVIRWSFKNLMHNYTFTPRDAILSILDADLEGILVSFWRFAINSSFGCFGLDDIARRLELPSYDKDMGSVLHFYHIPRGNYIMLPILGPSNLRDSIGFASYTLMFSSFWFKYVWQLSDYAYTMSYYDIASIWHIPFSTHEDLIWISFYSEMGNYYNVAIDKILVIKFLSEHAIDRYVNFRTSYFQNLDASEKRYMKLRLEGNTTRLNICDYEGMILMPDECNEDPKIYNTIIGDKNRNNR